MFSVEELQDVSAKAAFQADYEAVQQSLAMHRIQQGVLLPPGSHTRLGQFVEAVLASAPAWGCDAGTAVCERAAEVSELLALAAHDDEDLAMHHRFRAALLYELGGRPAIATAVLSNGVSSAVKDHLTRRGVFGSLLPSRDELPKVLRSYNPPTTLGELGLAADAEMLVTYEQGGAGLPDDLASDVVGDVASRFSISLTASECRAFSAVTKLRATRATRRNVPEDLLESLRSIHCPSELFEAQVEALRGGLLDLDVDSWGFASPTGTGKTFLTRILIAEVVRRDPDAKIVYVVPSRALVWEVAQSLEEALVALNVGVTALSAQLVDLDTEEATNLDNANVVVLTPEKADLLLRLASQATEDVQLVVIDEAHHIEAGTRGVLLELYLWRLRKSLPDTRFVFLSAVAPNIGEIADWASRTRSKSLMHARRATRMRPGVFRIKGKGKKASGVIEYSDGTRLTVVEQEMDSRLGQGITQLAYELGKAGPVLVVAKGKGEAERLAKLMQERIKSIPQGERPGHTGGESQDVMLRLDSRLEREMYDGVGMRKLLPDAIGYHHAGLPPRVRQSVEAAIRANLIHYVFATTTLAEGVNFPFSSVIVQSLRLRNPPQRGQGASYHLVSPRVFWNIAGRAGRPGHDREGQAILFEPSLGLDKAGVPVDPYLDPEIGKIEPVRSALAAAVSGIQQEVAENTVAIDDFGQAVLPESLPRSIQGAINLLRVGIIHARASQLDAKPEDIIQESFANRHFDGPSREFAKRLARQQGRVVDDYFSDAGATSVVTLARLGLSLSTVAALREYIEKLRDWQIENFSKLMFGPEVNLNQAVYVIGPVASRMAELEGPVLGGFYSDVVLQWLAGAPLSTIKSSEKKIEDLIKIIYSRVQYLLPWGLYAVNELTEHEARRRSIPYNGEIRKLSYLTDAGVPSFDALRLTALGFERVDATRLAKEFKRRGGLRLGVDVVTWLKGMDRAPLVACVRGEEGRRLDHDFDRLLAGLGTEDE